LSAGLSFEKFNNKFYNNYRIREQTKGGVTKIDWKKVEESVTIARGCGFTGESQETLLCPKEEGSVAHQETASMGRFAARGRVICGRERAKSRLFGRKSE
jgi:hypothetical protein